MRRQRCELRWTRQTGRTSRPCWPSCVPRWRACHRDCRHSQCSGTCSTGAGAPSAMHGEIEGVARPHQLLAGSKRVGVCGPQASPAGDTDGFRRTHGHAQRCSRAAIRVSRRRPRRAPGSAQAREALVGGLAVRRRSNALAASRPARRLTHLLRHDPWVAARGTWRPDHRHGVAPSPGRALVDAAVTRSGRGRNHAATRAAARRVRPGAGREWGWRGRLRAALPLARRHDRGSPAGGVPGLDLGRRSRGGGGRCSVGGGRTTLTVYRHDRTGDASVPTAAAMTAVIARMHASWRMRRCSRTNSERQRRDCGETATAQADQGLLYPEAKRRACRRAEAGWCPARRGPLPSPPGRGGSGANWEGLFAAANLFAAVVVGSGSDLAQQLKRSRLAAAISPPPTRSPRPGPAAHRSRPRCGWR